LTRLFSRRPRPRRALVDAAASRRGRLQHGVAALAVSVLGCGVAASVVLTGSAQSTTVHPTRTPQVPPASVPAAFAPRPTAGPSIGSGPQSDRLAQLSQARAQQLTRTGAATSQAAQAAAVERRAAALQAQSTSASRQARALAAARKGAAKAAARAKAASVPSACLPVSRYHVAARFGDVGVWARYHTGYDFAAPIGTPIRAPAAGVVTNAGSGHASGWAGNYVAIKYADGTQTLMAHMSTVSVRVGQRVTACSVVGAIGVTGRSFGPHLHFEVYPAGITPGDIYKAVDPVPWLHKLGLKP
jgi:murein DD-endopeptidase MepM/ murein hydrolase activator NlpD